MSNSKKLSKHGKQILVSWLIIAVLFFTTGIAIGATFFRQKAVPAEPAESAEPTAPTESSEAEPTVDITTESESIKETTPEPTPAWTYTSLGEYRLTAYCACEKCCGHWATIRPKDEDGNPIVYTANQSIAKQGVTVAADTSVLPFGTVLLIDDHEYIVQDRGGAINGNRIDIYFESHEEALQFGVQHKEVFKKEGDV